METEASSHDINHIKSDYKQQKVEWGLKRFFWVLMSIFILLGLLGLFGDSDGILNRDTKELVNASIEYDKYMRVEKASDIKIMVNENSKNYKVVINSDYIDKVKISQVIPEPESVEVEDGKLVYRFIMESKGIITFFGDPVRMGRQSLRIEVNGQNATLSQYIYF